MEDDGGPADSMPDPPVLVLVPLNAAARKAAEHERNLYYQIPMENNVKGLWISFENPSKQLFTLGRTECDIYIPEMYKGSTTTSRISHYQAAFRIVPETGAVLLEDHSELSNTEPYSNDDAYSVPFRGHPRCVIVCRGINNRVAFGHAKWYQFAIKWKSHGLYDFPRGEQYIVGPRKSQHKKYIQGFKVGGGAYGNVFWVIDVATGYRIAVKKFHSLSGKHFEFATREIRNLFKVGESNPEKHKHILQILDAAGGKPGDDWSEIFMPLMAGNLKNLVEAPNGTVSKGVIAEMVLQQMLHALVCLASHGLVHRDIKPENILWDYDEMQNYHFRLGDFGLSNEAAAAKTVAGTEPFMAPEVFNKQPQSVMVDIWSLFATVVWVHNTDNFRDRCARMSVPNIHRLLMEISKLPQYDVISAMASRNPAHRPSARWMLMMVNGEDPETSLSDAMAGMNLPTAYDESYIDSERPYYEPYGPNTQMGVSSKGKGKGKAEYHPPTEENYPREQAYVEPIDPTYQDEPDEGYDTVVPWTTVPLPTKGEPSDTQRQKGKGKKK